MKIKTNMNKEIIKINRQIRTIKKLKGYVFLIENMVWTVKPKETMRLEAEMKMLENRKFYIKKKEQNEQSPGTHIPQYSNSLDLDKIKSIPIKDYLISRGVKIGRGNFFKIRDENTASANFDEGKNLWIDRGVGQGGSIIDLVVTIEKLSVGEAIKELSRFL